MLTDKLIEEDLKARKAQRLRQETNDMAAIAANRTELLQIADAVARDKSIDKSVVLHAMEEAMQRAAKARYGSENEIRVEIDPKTGETHVSRYLHVVELVENDKIEISLEDARARNPAAQVGDIIAETLPPVDFSRIAAQAAKQVIVQKVRDAERERQYEEFKDRIGEIIHGIVKRVEFGSVVVDLGRAEGVVRRDEMIPRESFRTGDRIRAYIYDVRREARGPQIFLSRWHPQFMVRLFAQEVPEIYDGIIEIRAVARDPGSRAKIAVISKDSSIDPVGACVGMRGVRVQAVVQELQGERIDIIPWSTEAGDVHRQRAGAGGSVEGRARRRHPSRRSRGAGRAAFARHRPPRPERASRVAADRLADRHPDRSGRIASAARRNSPSAPSFHGSARCRRDGGAAAGVGRLRDDRRRRLCRRSTNSRPSKASTKRPRRNCRAARSNSSRRATRRWTTSAASSASRTTSLEVAGVTPAMAVALGEAGIKTLEDLAGCATDDLLGYYEVNKEKERVRIPGALEGFNLTAEDANAIIMKARVKVGWIEELPEEPAEEAVGEEQDDA